MESSDDGNDGVEWDMEKNNTKDIFYLHIAVMLFGISGVVAQFVAIPSVLVAMGRVICSSIILFSIAKIKKETLKLECRKDYFLIIATGIVLAIHWTTFFQSIKTSSVAIGTITFSTFPLFITFIEPIVFKEKLRMKSIISAIILLVGVIITIPEFSLQNQVTMGIIWGMISSLTYAVITLANRYFSEKYIGRVVCLYEQATAAIVLLPAAFFVRAVWKPMDIIGVIIIGCCCTAFAYSLYVSAQKGVRAQTAGIISGMETVYGIGYAFLFLGEVPHIREIIGGVIILGVALFTSLDTSQKEDTGK